MPTSEPRIPARFDPDPWDEDLVRSSPAARKASEAARHDYESDGVLISHLKPCEAEGHDGTRLPDCVKTYLPHPSGKFGMVFSINKKVDKPILEFLAFGMRHHPRESNAPTVYQLAHERLREPDEPDA